MQYEFRFPDVGEGIHEGEIVKWKVKIGDLVDTDQPLVEIETDKAVVDIPSPKAGKIMKINHKDGDTIKVGEVLVVIETSGKAEETKKEHYTGSVVGFLEEASENEIKTKSISTKEAKRIVLATPAIRALAKSLSVDLNSLKIEEGKRITEEDIRNAAKSQTEQQTSVKKGIQVTKKYDMWGYIEHVPLKGLKKSTAKHMSEAHTISVPITNFYDADINKIYQLREKDKKEAAKKGIHLTFIPYIAKAVVSALQKHRIVNSSLVGEEIIIKKYFNIGIAVDTDDGLIVPVVKAADSKDIFQIAKEIQNLAEKARQRKLDLMDLKGGSFTITNLGSIGVKYFTPMINYPEAAILGLGSIEEKAVVENGKIVIKKILPLSFTYDHRIIDGAEASRFMVDLLGFLEK